MLRGLFEDLVDSASKFGYEIDREEMIESPLAGITVDDIPDDIIQADFELDDDQKRCVVEWLRHGIGFNHVTVGGGKTALFAAAAAMIKSIYPTARFLYFAHAERLVTQSFTEMKKFLPGWDITKYGGGSRDNTGADMVVATGAIMNRNKSKLRREKWFESFVALLVDECHHVTSDSWERVMLSSKAFFRLGASDSASEDDIMKAHKMKSLVGPKRHEVGAAGLLDVGRLAVPHIYIVDDMSWHRRYAHLEHEADEGSDAWALINGKWERGAYMGHVHECDEHGIPVMREKRKMEGKKMVTVREPVILPSHHLINIEGENYEVQSRWCLLERMYDRAIIRFKERNELIVEWSKHFHGQDKRTLVVATRTAHVYILKSMLRKAVDPDMVDVLIGESSPKERNETFEWFKDTPGAILVTPLVKEGVSINEIDAGIIADKITSWDYAKQVIGRFVRPKKHRSEDENYGEIVMFMDRQHPKYFSSCRKLIKKLETIEGYKYYYPCLHPGSEQMTLPFDAAESS